MLKKILALYLLLIGLVLSSVQASQLDQAVQIAKNIPILQAQPFELSPLSGGLTNQIYLVQQQDGHRYVLKIFGSEAAALGINLDVQAETAVTLGKLGVGPKVLYLTNHNKHMLMSFASGVPLSQELYTNKVKTDLIYKLRTLHEQGNFRTSFDPFLSANKFRKIALDKQANIRNTFPLSKIAQASKILDKIQSSITRHSSHYMRSAHNDLHCYNILVNQQDSTVAIIDLDYAGISDLFFDLGILSNSLDLSFEQEQDLLADYFKGREITPRDQAHLSLMRLASIYWNSMWFYSQVGISTIDYDHLKGANLELDKFLQKTSTLQFKRWIKDLS